LKIAIIIERKWMNVTPPTTKDAVNSLPKIPDVTQLVTL
jgi:hypothetical protein